ncbi:IS5 family transposase [Wielerella bovis]|uniref:IS5 family transposase n=2 Tax=Wielerella bovis TaxID=2917790 RepID=UPI003211D84B
MGSKKRLANNKQAMPTYAIIDSQSVKTAAVAQDKGFDGGKKIKGRKRHIAVDTMGNLLAVVVHAANIHDTKAGIFVAQKAFETYPSLKGFCADAAYRRTFEQNVQDELGLSVDISVKIKDVSWQVLPKRWIVERTFAWLGWSRRLAKDFEQTILSAENFINLGYISRILKFIK